MLVKSLSKIVNEFLSSSDRSNHDFVRLYNIARRGVENEFNLDTTGGFKTVLLDVNPNKTVEIPEWACGWSKIGIVNQNGEFVTLKANDNLTTYHSIYYSSSDRVQGVPVLQTYGYGDSIPTGAPYLFPYYYFNFYNSGSSFNLFGLPSGRGTVGTYKIDVKNNIIVLGSDFNYSQILFEGLTDGFDEDAQDYMIDIKAAECMMNWIRWQNMIDLPKKYSLSAVKAAEKRYTNSKRISKVRLNPVNIGEMQDAERDSWKLTARA